MKKKNCLVKALSAAVSLTLLLGFVCLFAGCGSKDDRNTGKPAESGLVLKEELKPYVTDEQLNSIKNFLNDMAPRLLQIQWLGEIKPLWDLCVSFQNGYNEKTKDVLYSIYDAYHETDVKGSISFIGDVTEINNKFMDISIMILKASDAGGVERDEVTKSVRSAIEVFEGVAKLLFTEESVQGVYGDVLAL